jgi:hypothetical protein
LFVFAFFTPAITPPFAAHWSDTEPTFGSEIKNRASVSPLPFRHCHGFSFRWVLYALRARLVVSPTSEASSKRQGDGQRFQKKAMKTTHQNEASAPANVRSSSVSKTSKAMQAEFVRHCENRRLSTETVLNYLRTRLPRQYEVAEVVGKWVWLDVSPARKPNLASLLWALGFHWNQRRGVWQHPCGTFNPFGIHPADPRMKYRSYFPADVLPA